MFSIYSDNDCLYSDFQTEDVAINAAAHFIEQLGGEYISVGSDHENSWWVIKLTDNIGKSYYRAISVIKNI